MKNNILKEDIIKTYIEQNKSINECCEIFHVSRTTFKNRLKQYDIHKSIDDSTKCSRKVLLEKYGPDYCPLDNREKIKKTLITKYGVDNPMKSKDIKNKAKMTNIKKYGVEVPLQNKDILKKARETNLKKYGAECIFSLKDVYSKHREICLEKYNDEYPLRSKEYKDKLLEKRRQTNLERYGAEEITKSEFFKEKVKSKCREKYGTDSPNESIYSKTIFSSREELEKYLSQYNEKLTVIELCKKLNVSDTYILKKIHLLGSEDLIRLKPKKSSYEDDIVNLLVNNSISRDDILLNSKDILTDSNGKKLEIDIFIKSKNIAIEFNGTYWHSSIYKDRNYHKNKSLICERNGIRLIHIYEYEWLDKNKRKIIEAVLLNAINVRKNVIYARKCKIKEPSKVELKKFLNDNHLQGYRGSSKAYGLYYNNELVQVMTFGKNKKYGWEIIREASLLNTNVVGGSSKLFMNFLAVEKPKTVFSYCDFNKFTGIVYERMGMEFLGYTVPDMKWIINGNVVNRNPSKNEMLKNKASAKIFGAGSKKYLYKLSDAIV